MAEPTVCFRAMPVFHICRDCDNGSRQKVHRLFSFLLIPNNGHSFGSVRGLRKDSPIKYLAKTSFAMPVPNIFACSNSFLFLIFISISAKHFLPSLPTHQHPLPEFPCNPRLWSQISLPFHKQNQRLYIPFSYPLSHGPASRHLS